MAEKHRNYHVKYILTITFASISLFSSGILAHNAFAMGPYPGTCSNEYYGKFTNATIIVGNQTYYPLKDNVYFQLKSSQSYYLTTTIKISNQSSQGNSNPGSLWSSSNISGVDQNDCSGTVYPNQNITSSGNYGFPGTYNPDVNNKISVYLTVDGGSGFSYTVYWVATNPQPSVPQNIQASAGNAQVFLSWTASSSNGGSAVTNYQIYRGTSSYGEHFLTEIGNVTSYNDTSVTNGQTYFYEVIAINSAGKSSFYSNQASATTKPLPPATPTGITATPKSSSSITISWTAPATATWYNVFSSTSPSGPFVSIIGTTKTSVTNTGLSANTTYYYKVRAWNTGGGWSALSSPPVSATTKPLPPAVPTGVTATPKSSSSITISWTAPATATWYNVFSSTSPSGPFVSIIGTTKTSVTNTGLSASTTYYYEVRAWNTGGWSALSSPPVSATTLP